MSPRNGPTAEAFARVFNSTPEAVWWAPGRVNILGEHTDYNRGVALPCAIQLGVTVAIRRRADDLVLVYSTARDGVQLFRVSDALTRQPDWAKYAAAAIWMDSLKAGRQVGADIFIDATLPIGAGLSSSAALLCATLGALAESRGALLGQHHLEDSAQRVENELLGVPSGGLDFAAVCGGRSGCLLFLDFGSNTRRLLPFEPEQSQLTLLVVDTGTSHDLSDGGYTERVMQCHSAAHELGCSSLSEVPSIADLERLSSPVLRSRARHVITENLRVRAAATAIGQGRLESLATLLNESHMSLRDDFCVSTAQVDDTVTMLRENGAIGARLMGGGFGGSVLALVPSAALGAVNRGVHDGYESRGWAAPKTFLATPSVGAHSVA